MAQAPSYGARGLQRIIALPEGTSQSFKIGDFLVFDSSGTSGRVVQEVAAGSNFVAGTANQPHHRVIGRALQNATGVAGKLVEIIIAEPGTEFLLPVYHTTATSAVPDTAQLGKSFELKYVSGSPNYFAIDLQASGTSAAKVKVTDMYIPDHSGYDPNVPGYPTHNSATQYGQVWCTFIDEQTALTGATLV